MRKIEYYEAYDGTMFNTEERCKEYEANSKERIIEDFKRLIVRESEGCQITNYADAYALAEIAECWWYAVIVMKDDKDYETVKRYAALAKNDSKLDKIYKIYNKEILVGIGDGDREKADYNWFYAYGTIDEQVEKYRKALMTFGAKED